MYLNFLVKREKKFSLAFGFDALINGAGAAGSTTEMVWNPKMLLCWDFEKVTVHTCCYPHTDRVKMLCQ